MGRALRAITLPVLYTELLVQGVHLAITGHMGWPETLQSPKLLGVSPQQVEVQILVPKQVQEGCSGKVWRVEQHVNLDGPGARLVPVPRLAEPPLDRSAGPFERTLVR